jgi:hypothetical protein
MIDIVALSDDSSHSTENIGFTINIIDITYQHDHSLYVSDKRDNSGVALKRVFSLFLYLVKCQAICLVSTAIFIFDK